MNSSMESLSHWDYESEFSGQAAAALILGIDPNNLESCTSEKNRISVVTARMNRHYEHALIRRYHEVLNIYPDPSLGIETNIPYELTSVVIERLHKNWDPEEEESTFSDWLLNDQLTDFDAQKFSRQAISAWLQAIEEASIYRFDTEHTLSKTSEELDPSDYPAELDAANMAFRAISNGKGDQSATPRKRIVDYLKQNYPEFLDETIQRIATVANPDKSTGRKKSRQE